MTTIDVTAPSPAPALAGHPLPQGEREILGSMCIGRSAAPNARIATSIPMSAMAASTRRGSSQLTSPSLPISLSLAPGRSVGSVFFGGGTPSLMQASTVAAILEAIAKHWRLDSDAEITLEANPTSVEAERFAGYRAAGVNRLSLGVQALDDASLKALGRQHTAAEALAALDLAKRHFGRVSFDLIYAREGQTARGWREELSRALDHAADHLSLYQLTIEPGTPFAARHAAGTLSTPNGAEARAQYLHHAGAVRGGGAPRLRGLEPCAAGIGVAAQPALLARVRLCRDRARRSQPHRRKRHEARTCHDQIAGRLGRSGRGVRPRPRERGSLERRRSRRRISPHGLAAQRGHRSCASRRASVAELSMKRASPHSRKTASLPVTAQGSPPRQKGGSCSTG